MKTKKKKTTTPKKKVTTTPQERREMKLKEKKRKKTLRTIGLVMGYVLITLMIFLSFYSELLSVFGAFIKNTLMGLFGKVTYVVPFFMVYSFFYYYKQKKKQKSYVKIYLLCGFILNMSAIFSLAGYGGEIVPIRVERFYSDGINYVGGGIVGGFISEPLKSLISYVGTYILMIAILLFILTMFFYDGIIKIIENEKKIRAERPKKVKEEKQKAEKKELITEEVAEPKKHTEFTNIMNIHNEYEDDLKDDEIIDESVEDINITLPEKEILMEKENLDKILSKGNENSYKKVQVDDKVEEILMKPNNKKIEYKYPSIELLDDNKSSKGINNVAELKEKALKLENILESFGVDAEVVNIEKGPSITRFELQPKSGVRLSKIQSLQDDIKMNLAATSIRISPIPGKTVVGIEIPNDKTVPVVIKEIIASKDFQDHKSKIAFAAGMDITGKPVIGDIAKMPHVLIAGATGSGKSVCINSLITSILYKANPNEVKLIMVDPKVVELGVYNGIPHLLIPVVTDPKKAAGALNWAVREMEQRYKLFADNGVRNISGYNELMEKNKEEEKKLPQIVIIIDELADLMMIAPKDVEAYICRIAQLARAAGMHLVIATQRPSVNVITGLIKANIPSRIAFAVTSQIDSRTILDMGGAEKLLGKGDMLYYPAGETKPQRVQGTLISDKEVERIVNVVKANSSVEYDEEIMEHMEREQAYEGDEKSKEEQGLDADEKLPQAIEAVLEANQASTSFLQRRLGLGYSRAARIIDQMEARGIIGPPEGSKPRQILISREQYYEMQLNDME